MSLDASIASIFQRLEEWSHFPKYALERRLDIFLTPFLVEFFERIPEPDGKITLVAPEFPILSEIVALMGDGDNPPTKTLEEVSARTVNADYLLFRDGPAPAWLFVELKTDSKSLSLGQMQRYRAARKAGMETLLGHIKSKVAGKPDSAYYEKYQKVMQAMAKANAPRGAPIEIVYLAPMKPLRTVSAADWKPGNPEGRFHSLKAFAQMAPQNHQELWGHVRKVLENLT